MCSLLAIHATLYRGISAQRKTCRISQSTHTFNAKFPKLTTVCWKFLRVEGHVTKYTRYVNVGRDCFCSKTQPNMSSHTGSIDQHIPMPDTLTNAFWEVCICPWHHRKKNMCFAWWIVVHYLWRQSDRFILLKYESPWKWPFRTSQGQIWSMLQLDYTHVFLLVFSSYIYTPLVQCTVETVNMVKHATNWPIKYCFGTKMHKVSKIFGELAMSRILQSFYTSYVIVSLHLPKGWRSDPKLSYLTKISKMLPTSNPPPPPIKNK